jgi:hypothetical protein
MQNLEIIKKNWNDNKYVVFGIETAAAYPNLRTLEKENPILFYLYKEKYATKELVLNSDYESLNLEYLSKSPLIHELCKITTIVGYIPKNNSFEDKQFIVLNNESEKDLITKFHEYFMKLSKAGYILAGHNILNFDLPIIFKKFIKYELLLSSEMINTYISPKPWDTKVLDSFKMWQLCGGQSTSLGVLANFLDIEESKSNNKDYTAINAALKYWDGEKINKSNLEKITKYCKEDVICNYKVFEKLLNAF